jgi:Holliday junction resolvase-like predicted endonuclease
MSMLSKRLAEKSSRSYLEMRGFEVLELNWGLSKSKIDIIAKKTDMVYFVEIKYYANLNEPNFIDPLTQSKVDRYNTSAEAWTNESKYSGKFTFASIELAGPNFTVLSFNENLI